MAIRVDKNHAKTQKNHRKKSPAVIFIEIFSFY